MTSFLGADNYERSLERRGWRNRKVIYTTNAVESLNMSLRKAIKTRGAFPSEEAALKVM